MTIASSYRPNGRPSMPRGAIVPDEAHLTLFNRAAFHVLNVAPGDAVRRIDHHDSAGRFVGSLVGLVRDGHFISGHSAPFGGVDLVRDAETAKRVADLVGTALATLRDDGVREVTMTIRLRPPVYARADPHVELALLVHGFAVVAAELNHHIDLEGVTDARAHVDRLPSAARRALQRAQVQDLAYAEAQSPTDWAAAYDLLRRNREAKGRHLSLPLAYLERVRAAFPGRVRMATLCMAGEPVAAALTYRLRPEREYVVWWGDHGHDLDRSPMPLLALRLVERALAERVRTVDLGISSVEGRPDEGLAQFKQSVGGTPTVRLTLHRSLEAGQ
jgi:hypothetical protein